MTADGPRYVNEVEPSDVGRRVTVRHLVVEDGHDRPTDVVGDLVAADERSFTVRRRSGEQVVVDRARMVASKLLPPDPAAAARRRRGPRPD